MDKPKEISFQLSHKAQEFFKTWFDYPSSCPVCQYTHPSKLWVRKGDHMVCDNCERVLLIVIPAG